MTITHNLLTIFYDIGSDVHMFNNKLTLSLIIFLIAASFALSVKADSSINLNNSLAGTIKLNLYPTSDNVHDNNDNFPLFTTISRIGTGFSVFFTSAVYFFGVSPQSESVGPIPITQRSTSHFDDRSSPTFMPFMAFMSVLGTSLFNYKTGTDNDVIAIMPIVPMWPDNHFTKANNNVNFDYGFFLYFSKDF